MEFKNILVHLSGRNQPTTLFYGKKNRQGFYLYYPISAYPDINLLIPNPNLLT